MAGNVYPVFVVGPDGNVDVRELPGVSEMGLEEGWSANFKDVFDDWSTKRSTTARAWDVNLKAVTDAWQKEFLRGSQSIDDLKQKLDTQYLEDRAAQKASERRFQEKVDNIFANALQMSLERQGATQGVLAQNIQYNPQDTAADAISAGLANQSWTQAAVQSAVAEGLASSGQTQDAVQSAIASGLANAAQTQGAVESAIAAAVAAMSTDLAQSFRNSIEAMQTSLAQQVNAMGALIVEAVKGKED